LQIRPNFAEAHNNLGVALRAQGQLDAAVASYRKAVELKPDFTEAHNNLGSALQALGQLDDAAASYRRALQINPNFAEAHSNLGFALKDLGQLDDAVASYRRALEINPNFAEAHNNLGVALKDLGQLDTSLASYRRALEISPNFAMAHNNLLLTLNYTAHTPEYCLEEARKYGRMVDKNVTSRFSAWQCADQPERLRVGMVSGDLRNNSVGLFLEGLLAHIDPARIELIAYSTHHKEDELTARIRPYFSFWKPLIGKSDEAAARLIHTDGVHILLDLSGHTAHNRLPVFAWKPAPVQAIWLGYFATTGVAEMDYILGDRWTLPDGEEHHFVEKGWRLSGALSCLTPPTEDIKVEELPALRNQSITFGTLNNPTKMNDRVVACWAHILNEIPNSRLYLNMSNLRNDALRKTVIERYAAHGIAENRLILEATTGRGAALNSYNRIDIALDPFPYPGGTTSYEALWMGVPILTMRGSNYLSHLGESIMHNAGLPDWIAANEEDYIAKAVAYSSNLANLMNLRSNLRARVLASPLFDAPLFARSFEAALWGMWQARTQGNSPTSPELLTASRD
jgi:protein O-GlcNAc transferase